MDYKSFVGCIYIKDGKCVKSFKDNSVIDSDPIKLAERYYESDMDAIIVFDLGNSVQAHYDFVQILSQICDRAPVLIYAGGNIQSEDDAKRLFTAGCEKIVLNFAKQTSQDMLICLSQEFGKERITATIASEDNLVINKDALEKYASQLILIDEFALKNNLGASVLPCIVFLPEISLDKMFEMMCKTNVLGISGNIVNENSKEIAALKKICDEQGIIVNKFKPLIPFSELKLLSDGLIPVVVQDYITNQVLMVAYMNEEAYLTTLRTRKMTYYSRSRKELWIKGLTSGHFQYVKGLSIDCDNDTLLAKVKQVGAACHTGNYSCFYRDLIPMDINIMPDNTIDSQIQERNSKISECAIEFAKKILEQVEE